MCFSIRTKWSKILSTRVTWNSVILNNFHFEDSRWNTFFIRLYHNVCFWPQHYCYYNRFAERNRISELTCRMLCLSWNTAYYTQHTVNPDWVDLTWYTRHLYLTEWGVELLTWESDIDFIVCTVVVCIPNTVRVL